MNTLPFLAATLLASVAGAHATYFLTHRRRMNRIRAASWVSLAFIAAGAITKNPLLLSLQPAVFGSTFVAMSEPWRLEEKRVLLAAAIFGLLLFGLQISSIARYRGGVGGTLGGTAFVACSLVYLIQWWIWGKPKKD